MSPVDRQFRLHVLLVALAVVGVAGVLLLVGGRAGPVGRYVVRPVPESVRGVRVDSNDWVFGLNPEPVVYLSFTASMEDLERIIAIRRYDPAPSQADWISGRGPAWWWPPLRNEGTRVWARAGRRGTEFLILDRTGTNAWFMLWGI